jgi:RNA-directed DNA polymerase
MNLATPSSVQKLQAALHDKAKGSPSFRFYALYDKVYRKDVLAFAYQCCKANGGAAGVDGQSFKDIEEYGVEGWLDELAKELESQTYRPQPVRRVWIPKPDGKQRPLGVPTVSANCTRAQFAFGMGGDPPSVPSASRPALPGFESPPNRRY